MKENRKKLFKEVFFYFSIILILTFIILALIFNNNYFLIGSLLGFVGILIYFFINDEIKKRLEDKGKKKKLYFWVKTIIVFIICLFVFQLVDGELPVLDLSTNKYFSLSKKTQEIAKSLDSEFEIKFFVTDQELQQFGEAKSIDLVLKEYDRLSKKLNYKVIDPDINKDIADSYSIENGSIVLEYKGRTKNLYSWEFQEIKQTMTNNEKYFIGEKIITTAMEYLIAEEGKVLYFLKGHKEKYIDDYQSKGYSSLKTLLESKNRIVKSLDLLSNDKIPEDCSLLVLANPIEDYADKEIKIINNYIDSNGKFILITDFNKENQYDKDNSVTKMIQKTESNIVTEILSKFGLKTLDGVVIHNQQFVKLPLSPYLNLFAHEITNPLQAENLVPIVNAMKPIYLATPSKTIGESKFLFLPIVTTKPGAFNEIRDNYDDFSNTDSDYDKYGNEQKATYPLVLEIQKVIEKEDGEKGNAPVGIVLTDSDWLGNDFMSGWRNNKYFIENIVNYMLNDNKVLNIPGKKISQEKIVLTVVQRRVLFVFVFILIPLISFVFLFLISRRRS